MKTFERLYLCAEPFLPPLYRKVRGRLLQLSSGDGRRGSILDVGGRKSHYTIGIPADVTIGELPRHTEVQNELNLGINDTIRELILARRSNVRDVLYDDMTKSALPDAAFDCVVAVEVLEHVEDDRAFVKEVHRVLKPGGAFLMTTPNGDFVKNTNPDHKRHYTKPQLTACLNAVFPRVTVEYAIQGGKWRDLGLKSWSLRHPIRTSLSMLGNVINGWQSSKGLEDQPIGTRHLIGLSTK